MNIEILIEEYCNYAQLIRGYSKQTIDRYRCVLRNSFKLMGVVVLNGVSENNVRGIFYRGRNERHWSVNTFLVYHKTLLVFFRWCIKQGYMTSNPVADIEVPRLEKRLPPKLSRQTTLRLLEIVYNQPYGYRFLRYRNHAIFATFIFAGLRKQELLNLKYADADLENMTIFVRQGKGQKDRVVPMSHVLAQSLKRYLEERRRLGKTNPEFFSSLRGNHGFTATGLKRLIKNVRGSSGISFTAHKLRHTFATLMLEGGCDIYSLSRMMGHSDIKTTTIYLAASAEHLRSQMMKHPLNYASGTETVHRSLPGCM